MAHLLPLGQIQRITNDLNSYSGVSLADDGHTLITIREQVFCDIWLQTQNKLEDASPISGNMMNRDGEGGIAWMSDGRIVYTSDAQGNQDIWIMRPDGNNKRRLTTFDGTDILPTVADNNDKYIVFVSVDTTGADTIWRMDIDGGHPTQLTFGNLARDPKVSPDGRWILYEEAVGKGGLMKLSIEGGEPAKIWEGKATSLAISPDSKWITYRFQDQETTEWLIGVMPFESGEVAHVFENQRGPLGWSPDSKGICYVKDIGEGGDNLWLQPLDGGESTQITHFKGDEWISDFDWEPGGKRLAVVRSKTFRDAVLIRNFH